MTDTHAVLMAAAIAAEAHSGQMRKHGLGPYIQHPFKVAEMVMVAGMPTHAVQAALLHDVVEDCGARWYPRIEALGADVTRLVVALTKPWPDGDDAAARAGKPAYYARIVATPLAADLKLLDRTDNLRDMRRLLDAEREDTHERGDSTRRWIRRYVAKTEKEIVPLLAATTSITAQVLFHEALEALR
jgi:guanosine-3',5'-bis(diphosphate) 3'-pyrophosphohydrolase